MGMSRENEFGGGIEPYGTVARRKRGTGPFSAGQSGDTQGLSFDEDLGEESVGELVEEGQFFEAELMTGIEKAAEGGLTEVRTQQVPEDDVPEEYRDRD